MYVIINQHRAADNKMVVNNVTGPFESLALAEAFNQRYPSPDYNQIVWFRDIHLEQED